MKARYNQLANSASLQEDSVAVLHYPEERKITEATDVLAAPYIVITRINVIYWIQWDPRAKKMVIHLDRLAPYLGATWDV